MLSLFPTHRLGLWSSMRFTGWDRDSIQAVGFDAFNILPTAGFPTHLTSVHTASVMDEHHLTITIAFLPQASPRCGFTFSPVDREESLRPRISPSSAGCRVRDQAACSYSINLLLTPVCSGVKQSYPPSFPGLPWRQPLVHSGEESC